MIGFAYRKEVPLFANVGLYIDFAANSAGASRRFDAVRRARETARLSVRRPAASLEQALTHRSHGAGEQRAAGVPRRRRAGCAVADELYAALPAALRRQAHAPAREPGARGGARRGGADARHRRAPAPGRRRARRGARGAALDPRRRGRGGARRGIPRRRLRGRAQAPCWRFGPLIERLDPERPAKDAKTRLQEILQARHRPLPQYRVVAVQGEAHKQSFEVECDLSERDLRAHGHGHARASAPSSRRRKAMLEKLATRR